MPGDCHDGAVAGLRLGKLRNCVMPQVVEAQSGQGTLYLGEVGLALRVPAPPGRPLLPSASRTLDQSRQIDPRSPPTPLWPRGVEV